MKNTTTSHTPRQLTPAIKALIPGKQWVNYSHKSKLPLNPTTGKGADCNDPDTWASYEQAIATWKSNPAWYAGIGYEFMKEQSITGVDLDKCIDEQGNLTPYAQEIVKRLNSYTEYSPSRKGLHILVYGSLPDNIDNDIEADGECRIEMYDHQRYFTVTGNHLPGTPPRLEHRQDELLAIYHETIERRVQANSTKDECSSTPISERTTGNGHELAYVLKAVQDEYRILSQTASGGRNTQLNKSAYALGQLIAGNGKLSRTLAESTLYEAAVSNGLLQEDGARSVDCTLRSGIEDGMLKPRDVPALEEYKPSKHTASSNGNGNAHHNGHDTISHSQSFNLTDLGNAERFAAQYRDQVRWCTVWNSWLVFNGKYWEQDRAGKVDQLAKKTVRSILIEAANEPDDAKSKQLVKHALASESNRAIRALLDRAKSELPATPEEFNTHLHLLNCKNGTLDLQNGELRPHNPHDMLTRCLKINYNPLATCEKWEAFIASIFAENADLIHFMRQALGMSLSGDTSEQCLFICHGSGSNGKTTMLETVRLVMASYGLAANIETFQMRKGERINNDVAELYGARFVTASENTLGSRLNEAFIKKATGKEPLRARRLHENEFEFMPEFTLWFAVNHKPVVKDTSKGMWRRVHFIPFTVTIEGDQVDKRLGEKLLEESEGILAWLVQGCISWYQQGRLNVPKCVQEATQAYRAEMDVAARFLGEECEFGEGKKISTKLLLERFESWCEQNGDRYDAKSLKTALNERGYHSKRSTGGLWVYHNIGLVMVSDGSDGSDIKNTQITRDSQTSQKSANSPSPTVTPSLLEHETAEKSDGTVTLSSEVRQFIEQFSSQPGYSLRLKEGGGIVIGVPASVSDAEFEAISAQVLAYGEPLLEALQAVQA